MRPAIAQRRCRHRDLLRQTIDRFARTIFLHEIERYAHHDDEPDNGGAGGVSGQRSDETGHQ